MATTIDGIPVGGSTGKVTFGRNRYGAYTRRRTKPVNPNTVIQATNRGYFRAAVTAWFDQLTSLERDAWKTYAEATPWLNRAGESTFLTGQAAFIRQYVGLSQTIGGLGDILTTARVAPSVPATGALLINSLGFVYDTGDTEWKLNLSAAVENNTWQDANAASFLSIAMSEPMSVGRSFHPQKFRYMTSYVAQNPADPTPNLSGFAPPYSLDVAGGQHVWFRFRAWSQTTRLLSVEQIYGPVLTLAQA